MAVRLRDQTQRFQDNEKAFYVKVKDFHGDDEPSKKQQELDDKYFEDL